MRFQSISDSPYTGRILFNHPKHRNAHRGKLARIMSEESKKAPEAADEAPIEKTEVPHKKLYLM